MQRILIGSDPLVFKVSKPGFDVTTATDDQMLMSLDVPPLMVVAAGRISLSNGVPFDVLWPRTLSAAPVLDVQRILSGTTNLVPFRSTSGNTTRVTWVSTTTKVTFTANANMLVTYVAVTRGQT